MRFTGSRICSIFVKGMCLPVHAQRLTHRSPSTLLTHGFQEETNGATGSVMGTDLLPAEMSPCLRTISLGEPNSLGCGTEAE